MLSFFSIKISPEGKENLGIERGKEWRD